MKRLLTVIMVLAVLALSVTCFAEEVYKPGKANTGKIGTSSYKWGDGYFKSLHVSTPDITQSVAIHGFSQSTVGWTLSSDEAMARVLYLYGLSSTGGIVTAPAEKGRIYTVINNGGYNITFKANGSTGITLKNRMAATFAYLGLPTGTSDYIAIATAWAF